MKHYRVKQGDTIASIAEAKQVRESSLIAANEKINPDRLRPGQILRIPDPEPVEPIVQESEKDAQTVPAPEVEAVPEPAPAVDLTELERDAAIGRAYRAASEAIHELPEVKALWALLCPDT